MNAPINFNPSLMKNDCLPAPPEPFDPRPGRFPRAGGLERPQTPRRPRAFLRPHCTAPSVFVYNNNAPKHPAGPVLSYALIVTPRQ